MAVWMVERNLAGISMDALASAQGAAIAKAEDSTKAGKPVKYMRSVFTPEDGGCRCLFEAATAEDVQAVNDAAGLPYQRIVAAMDLPPPGA